MSIRLNKTAMSMMKSLEQLYDIPTLIKVANEILKITKQVKGGGRSLKSIKDIATYIIKSIGVTLAITLATYIISQGGSSSTGVSSGYDQSNYPSFSNVVQPIQAGARIKKRKVASHNCPLCDQTIIKKNLIGGDRIDDLRVLVARSIGELMLNQPQPNGYITLQEAENWVQIYRKIENDNETTWDNLILESANYLDTQIQNHRILMPPHEERIEKAILQTAGQMLVRLQTDAMLPQYK